ncbi:MerR family transcriptional regulator [Companilactobacillus metriopterae]|uniref:MerR family transcriptional regulator n=1 Tax=Companilactobacillus metriopterae TaxID=1909267 RepID=UPI003D780EDC
MYKIGEFSKKVNISIDTLRYYEKECLIVPERIENNLRVYNDKDLIWIEFIKRLKLTGMSIKNIKKYANLRYEGNETIPQRLELLFDQRHKLESEQETIKEHINFINNKINIYHKMQKEISDKKVIH